jgi:hypothetical protein
MTLHGPFEVGLTANRSSSPTFGNRLHALREAKSAKGGIMEGDEIHRLCMCRSTNSSVLVPPESCARQTFVLLGPLTVA